MTAEDKLNKIREYCKSRGWSQDSESAFKCVIEFIDSLTDKPVETCKWEFSDYDGELTFYKSECRLNISYGNVEPAQEICNCGKPIERIGE